MNLFTNPKPDKRDTYVIGGLIILTIIFIIGYLQSSALQNYGLIYGLLTLLIFIFIAFALASRFKFSSWVFYGKSFTRKTILINALIGVAIAVIILSFSNNLGFSIAIPLSVSGLANSGNILNYLIVSFYSPFIEEIFWIGVLLPTLFLWSKSKSRDFDIITFLIIIGFFVLFFGTEFIGILGIIIAIILFSFGILLSFKKIDLKLGTNKSNTFALIGSLFVADIFIVLLHVYAYGNLIQSLPLFLSAGLFFFLEGIIDIQRQSIIPSIMMHTVNNSIIAVTAMGIIPSFLGIPTWFLSVTLMIIFLLVLGEGYNNGISPTKYIGKLVR